MHQSDIQSRIIRVLIFILLGFVVIRYLSGVSLSDIDQIKIVLGFTICFMFVNTYYPTVVIQNDDTIVDAQNS